MASDYLNKLQRSIPDPVKRLVRQDCKFGCVVCRSAFYQYDHFQPEFKEAVAHDRHGICCLCGNFHAEVTSGRFSREYVKKKRDEVTRSSDVGNATSPLDFHNGQARLEIGGIEYPNVPLTILQHYEEAILRVIPSSGDAPGALDASFFVSSGNLALEVRGNEITARSAAWDIEAVGRTITVRSGPREIALRLRVDPPGKVIVECLDMPFGDLHVLANEHALAVGRQLDDARHLWFCADMEILSKGAPGAAVAAVHPEELAYIWNGMRAHPTRRPICRVWRGGHGLEFKNSGFRGIDKGMFSTATLLAERGGIIIDSELGAACVNAGVALAHRCGHFMIGSYGAFPATLKRARFYFKGQKVKSNAALLQGHFAKRT